jgi:SAM-dependent methyltransferase
MKTRAQEAIREAHAQLERQDVGQGMTRLHHGLNQLRREIDDDGWREFAQSHCLSHPIRELVHQDSFTRRSFEKPRGYAGDADLIDFLYGEAPSKANTALGVAVGDFMREQPSAVSVRQRRRLIAQELDAVAHRVRRPRVLSIACGHLREAQRSAAVLEGRVGEYLALDQDRESLALVDRELKGLNVRTVEGSVRSILAGKVRFSDLDFVYSAGLFDYLSTRAASKLTSAMFSMLRPGGKLLVGNFGKDVPEAGYMEAFMDWWLIHRDEADLQAWADAIPIEQRASTRIYRDEPGNVLYLELVRGE